MPQLLCDSAPAGPQSGIFHFFAPRLTGRGENVEKMWNSGVGRGVLKEGAKWKESLISSETWNKVTSVPPPARWRGSAVCVCSLSHTRARTEVQSNAGTSPLRQAGVSPGFNGFSLVSPGMIKGEPVLVLIICPVRLRKDPTREMIFTSDPVSHPHRDNRYVTSVGSEPFLLKNILNIRWGQNKKLAAG